MTLNAVLYLSVKTCAKLEGVHLKIKQSSIVYLLWLFLCLFISLLCSTYWAAFYLGLCNYLSIRVAKKVEVT